MKTKYQTTPAGILSYPVPEETKTYIPVSNKSLLKGIVDRANKYELKLKSQRYRSSKNGIFSGNIALSAPDDKDFSFMVAFVNSYNKQKALAVAAGASVLVCSNGCIFGDVTFMRKHTGNVREELDSMIDFAFDRRMKVLEEVREFRSKTQGFQLTERKISHLLGELLYEKEILSPNETSAVIQEIKTSPTFPMVDGQNMNLWYFYNNVTAVLKNSHPSLSVTKDSALSSYVLEDVLKESAHKPFSFHLTGDESSTEEIEACLPQQ